ncbi:MAG: Bax inhibitor-1/YccA family protein [Spirochaetia bacterium]|jgi:FtsH-binding integral membrane protein|nr:Bax inhibitor-1/YccA family protein [Spirochaetia bacterium]
MFAQNPALPTAAERQRSILRNVYVWMPAALLVTGGVAYSTASNEKLLGLLFSTNYSFFIVLAAQLGIVVLLSRHIMRLSVPAASAAFAVYAALNGVTMSVVFLVYADSSIAMTFFITAGTFAGMSLYAISTKRDLSGWGTYLGMGLWGILIASLANIFLKSSGLDWLISLAGVAVFTGLTAYDTQRIKKWDKEGTLNESDFVRLSIIGALHLYLDFINLFLDLLKLFGKSRD